jgi:Uma2 family endonuclease
MSTTVAAIPRKRFTRSEVEQMYDAGLFAGQRLELIDGELLDKMGQKPPHIWVIGVLQDLLISLFGNGRVRIQRPIEVQIADQKWTLPEPDLVVLKEDKPDFKTRYVTGSELLLLIEVADTSVQFDLTIKRDLYARSEVGEYWVVDLNKRCVIVHRHLQRDKYTSINAIYEGETLAMETAGATFSLAQFLP